MATNQIKNLGANGVFSQKTPGDLTSLAKNPLVVPKIGGSIPLAMDLADQKKPFLNKKKGKDTTEGNEKTEDTDFEARGNKKLPLSPLPDPSPWASTVEAVSIETPSPSTAISGWVGGNSVLVVVPGSAVPF